MPTVLLPLPDRDFDVTEVAVPWKLLTRAGVRVVFATEHGGQAPTADPLLLTGVLFGQLGAEKEPIQFYREMESSPEFTQPVSWESLDPTSFEGLILPGGHARGMRQYLSSVSLQRVVSAFWGTQRPVGAICHGTVVLARTRDAHTGRSVLSGVRTTCLPLYMEALAYGLTFWKLGRYYRTYPAYVESEVRTALADADGDFERGPIVLGTRGTESDHRAAFCVRDGRYLSARWPGDVHTFAKTFDTVVREYYAKARAA